LNNTARKSKSWRRIVVLIAAVAVSYFLIAYVALPLVWSRYERRHPGLVNAEEVTQTGDHHPGDPINLALIGSEADLKGAMKAAGWFPADPLGLRSDVEIAADTVLRRKYETAPVSNLFYWGRKEDFAFEMPAASNPSKRHHVRFWKSAELDEAGRPIWMGAATYDKSVGLSHTTGQITHHIDGDVDAERDHVLASLEKAKASEPPEWIQSFHKVLSGKNGGGDAWRTDGRLAVSVLIRVPLEE
jgi:hypothetical protein